MSFYKNLLQRFIVSSPTQRLERIAIVGAGPCGLSQLHAFESAKRNGEEGVPDMVCFEKQSEWGGLWNYNWRTGLDEFGEPVHGSMYRFLWSNGPKECIEFADYSYDQHFGKVIPSYAPREVLYNYITGRAIQSGIRKCIQFNTVVRWVSYSETTGKFTVVVKDLKEDATRSEEFDYVIIATGHFSVPDMPHFEGIDKFPGRVLHSHDFRDAREFAGKDLLIIGSSFSAEDIGLQCCKYGAKSITFSYRKKPMGFPWPPSFKEVPILTKLDGRTAHFKDGTCTEVDTIILCTGYLHQFPFLPDVLRLRTNNRLIPHGVYKGIFWVTVPKLMYLGMQDQHFTFPMFDAQARYVRDVVLGKIKLPPSMQMTSEIASWRDREDTVSTLYQGIDLQKEYILDLMKSSIQPPKFDLETVASYYKKRHQDKMHSIVSYRDGCYTSVVTGTKALGQSTAWMNAMDDSITTFMDKCEPSN